MTAVDEQDAIKALTYRLAEWGVDGASDKARQFIGDLTARGWQMAANVRPIRRPPTRAEECATHPGEWREFCRACVSERKAARDDTTPTTGRWTPERIRAQLATPAAEADEALCGAVAETDTQPVQHTEGD